MWNLVIALGVGLVATGAAMVLAWGVAAGRSDDQRETWAKKRALIAANER